MTAPPAYVLEETRRRRESRGPIWNGIALTIAFVTAGAIVASMTLSTIRTPSDVAEAYVQARFDRDWSAAWDLVCAPARAASGDYQTYADKASEAFRVMPFGVDVSTGPMEPVFGSSVAVPVTVKSLDYKDWEVGGHLILDLEDGRFRVCGSSLAPL